MEEFNMLVSAKEMLEKAVEGHYAVGQFNINNLEWTRSALLAAEEVKSPIILGVSEGAGKWMTGFKTVHASHAAAVINRMVRRVDARRLAAAGAEFATVAFRHVETRPEQRAAGQHAQQRSHRADRVAPRASAAPSEEGESCERHDGDEEHPEALHPHLVRIDCVAVDRLGVRGVWVVAPRFVRCD